LIYVQKVVLRVFAGTSRPIPEILDAELVLRAGD